MADLLFLKGINSVFKFYLDGSEIVLNCKSWDCKVNVTKISDGVNGEDRDRLDRVVNYFEITADCFQRNMDILQAALKDIQNDDSVVPPLDKAGGIRMKIYDGSKKAYLCKEMVWDDFSMNASGRADRTMMKLTMRFRYFTEVKSI